MCVKRTWVRLPAPMQHKHARCVCWKHALALYTRPRACLHSCSILVSASSSVGATCSLAIMRGRVQRSKGGNTRASAAVLVCNCHKRVLDDYEIVQYGVFMSAQRRFYASSGR